MTTATPGRLSTHAAALREAEAAAVPIEPLTTGDPDLTIAEAYRIQSLNIQARVDAGAQVLGRKAGLTSRPMQEMMGVEEPDFGTVLDDMLVDESEPVPAAQLIQPRVEAEIAFVLERDLAGPGVTTTAALRATAGVIPAIEIIDSRIRDWRIALADTIADNASSGRVVLGARLTALSGLDLRTIGMVVSRDGEVVDTGAGAAVLGDPLRAVVWLANTLGALGTGLKAGDVLLAGALHRAFPVAAGDAVQAEFAGLGTVTARFAADGSR